MQYTNDAGQRYGEHMTVTETSDSLLDDDLAGVHDTFGVKELLDFLHPFNTHSILGVM